MSVHCRRRLAIVHLDPRWLEPNPPRRTCPHELSDAMRSTLKQTIMIRNQSLTSQCCPPCRQISPHRKTKVGLHQVRASLDQMKQRCDHLCLCMAAKHKQDNSTIESCLEKRRVNSGCKDPARWQPLSHRSWQREPPGCRAQLPWRYARRHSRQRQMCMLLLDAVPSPWARQSAGPGEGRDAPFDWRAVEV